jgi:hypothetical protein
MFIVGSFEYSLHLELAISELEKRGIPRTSIVAVPLDKRMEDRKVLDSIHYADGVSLFDGATILGTFFMLFGAIYGFIFEWGPIIWGIIGLVVGATLGFLGDILISKIRTRKRSGMGKNSTSKEHLLAEVFLLIECDDSESKMVETVLWDNLAMGVGSF